MTSDAYSIGRVLLSDVERRPSAWLWPGYIQVGKLTMLEGDPGVGKSSVLGDLAARITRGAEMPDGSRSDLAGPMGVVYLAGEEDLGDTLLPRIEAAGGDPRLVMVRESLYRGHERTLPTIEDVEWLARDVRAIGAGAIIIDPLTEFLPERLNSFRDAEVRRSLAPLRDLAGGLAVPVITGRHLRKGKNSRLIHAGAGSIGFGGVARSVLHCDRNPNAPEERVLVPVKVSNAKEGPSLRYRLVDSNGVGVVEWLGTSDIRAWDLEDTRSSQPRTERAMDRAAEWLRAALADGPVPSETLRRQADAAGVAWATLRRAADGLGIQRTKAGMSGPWVWKSGEDAQLNAKMLNEIHEHLREEVSIFEG